MINFDEEIKNYEPSLEIEEAESAIYKGKQNIKTRTGENR